MNKKHVSLAMPAIMLIFGMMFFGCGKTQKNDNGNMVRIQGGTFMMGSPDNEPEHSGDETQHQVTVGAFYMGKYPVTQKEYHKVMRTRPSYFKIYFKFKGNNLPVESISWYDAVNYCNALSQREGMTPAYTISGENVTWNRNADGYRLPTEAEWEYACRAETTTPFNTGTDITTDQANYDNVMATTLVGSFPPNPWGLYDMHGNVWEWCWDWYGDYRDEYSIEYERLLELVQESNDAGDYNAATEFSEDADRYAQQYNEYIGHAQTDPAGASSGSDRVIRGGSCYPNRQDLRSASRNYFNPSDRSNNLNPVGFRLVRS